MIARCTNCGRKLKDAMSIQRGYGPVCWDRIQGCATSREHKVAASKSVKPAYYPDDIIPGQMNLNDFPGIMPGAVQRQ